MAMSLACSIHRVRTVCPWMSIPRMFVACSSASASIRGELHAAGLAAPADQHLGLHDDGIADLVSRRDGVLDRRHGLAVGHPQAVAGKQLLALVLEQVHCGAEH